ncbi:MAG: LptF/LptG family permease [Rickettsiales bacterium]|jgi:lipopolysaccharide export system permease protein|nr:LptF/LptG family permease [Rickettsiales bacterium]
MQIKPKILTWFLMRKFLSSFLLVLLVVAGIIFIITFVEKLPGEPNAASALSISFALLLEYVPLMLPLVIFIGTLLASYNLTRSSEGVIISSAGRSPYQAMQPFLIMAAIIGIIATCIINPISVRMNTKSIGPSNIDLVDGAIWLREISQDGTFTMRGKGIRRDGDKLVFSNASAFIQDSKSRFKERIESKEIVLGAGEFSAISATVYDASGVPKARTRFDIKTLMTPETVLERHLKPDQVSFWKLSGFIKSLTEMGLNTRGHFIQFWTLLFLPLTLVAMVVLGAAFSQTNERRNFSFGMKFAVGMLACFILYFIINVFTALGVSGALPTVLAVLAPPLIILSAAAIAIVSFDAI